MGHVHLDLDVGHWSRRGIVKMERNKPCRLLRVFSSHLGSEFKKTLMRLVV
jgi:hypothetical protein